MIRLYTTYAESRLMSSTQRRCTSSHGADIKNYPTQIYERLGWLLFLLSRCDPSKSLISVCSLL